jgi:hypothetical protein
MGALAWYWDFVQPIAHGADWFGEPIPILRDPTLKGHFSNLAGRALADFLGREIETSWATLSYEGVLIHSGLSATGQRPDLLAVNPWRVVALEAKGYTKTSISNSEMSVHKIQASQGPLKRHAWAASVAYRLYDQIRVKYHDPVDDEGPPDAEAARTELRRYFTDVETAGDQLGGTVRTINQRAFVTIPLPDIVRGRVPLDVDSLSVLDNVSLLIEKGIAARTSETLKRLEEQKNTREPAPQLHMISNESLFIDADGIGISTASQR